MKYKIGTFVKSNETKKIYIIMDINSIDQYMLFNINTLRCRYRYIFGNKLDINFTIVDFPVHQGEFKVGDLVRIVKLKSSSSSCTRGVIGIVGKVNSISPYNKYLSITSRDAIYTIHKSLLQLIDDGKIPYDCKEDEDILMRAYDGSQYSQGLVRRMSEESCDNITLDHPISDRALRMLIEITGYSTM
jgi:hypothetical protein